jgi:hypothetical protein
MITPSLLFCSLAAPSVVASEDYSIDFKGNEAREEMLLGGMAADVAARCILALFVIALTCSAEEGQPVLTVCEALQGLPRYVGKVVIVIGRLDYTPRGMWLDLDCSEKLTTGSYVWSTSIATSNFDLSTGPPPTKPDGFRWPKAVLNSKLRGLLATSTPRGDDHWVAVYGRLDAHLPLRTMLGIDGRMRADGFGYAHSDPAQLVAGKNSVVDMPVR